MTDEDLAQISAVMQAALGPLQSGIAALKAKSDAAPDLNLLLRAAQRQQADLASFRDDTRILTAIAMRLDNSQSPLLEEIRAVHAQISRMNDRIRRLEDEQSPPLSPPVME